MLTHYLQVIISTALNWLRTTKYKPVFERISTDRKCEIAISKIKILCNWWLQLKRSSWCVALGGQLLQFLHIFCLFIGPRSDHSLSYISDWLTHSQTFADGIKYLSDVDIEMELRFSCQRLVTAVKACKTGNSCNSCQSWWQWIDS